LITGDVAAVSGAARTSSGESDARALIPKQAIRLLARIIAELQDCADRSGPCEPDYAAPTLTFNPGVIRSEPGRVTLEFELRPPPALALEAVDEGVTQLVDNQRGQFDDLDIDLTRRRANPGFRSALDSETVELAMAALARAGLPLNCGVKAGCTEAAIYAAAGLEPIVFGPGPSTGVIHAPNEYNFLAEVGGAIRFYRELIRS